jgi:hypothetical protein
MHWRIEMKRAALIGTVLAMAAISGSCAYVRTTVDFDETVDFEAYDSYTWFNMASSPELGRPSTGANDIVEARIRRSVNREFERRGLSSGTPEEVDLLVTYHLALSQRVVLYSGGWGHPYRGWWGWGSSYGSARAYTEGTLVVDVVDRSSRRLVWRGIAEGAITRPNPSEEHIAKVVSKLMTGFPG